MKKIILFGMAIFAATQLFAIMLPEGTDARVLDIKEEDDIIVKAELYEPTVLNSPIGPLECSGTVYFYKNGKIRSASVRGTEITTNIGKIAICKGISFYESGALGTCHLWKSNSANANILTTGLGNVKICDYSNRDWEEELTFYDSGSPDVFQLRSFYVADLDNKKNNRQPNECQFTCDAGTFWISIKKRNGDRIKFVQNPSGKIPEVFCTDKTFSIKTPLGTTTGRNSIEEWDSASHSFKTYECPITFREDGSLKGFVTTELNIVQIAGQKVNIPAGTYLSFYENGNICEFSASNNVKFDMFGTEVEFPGTSKFRVSEDGQKIISSSWFNMKDANGIDIKNPGVQYIEEFYDNGIPKKMLIDARQGIGGLHSWFDKDAKISVFAYDYGGEFNGLAYLERRNDGSYYRNSYKLNQSYIGVDMVYFSENGEPDSYSIVDDFGNSTIYKFEK